MQILQPENDREAVDDVRDDDSRKLKSAEADVMSQMPKPKFVACSTLGNDITEVSQTAKASIVLKEYNVAIQEECPISVENVSEQIRYLDEPRQCSNCSVDKTDDSKLFSDKA